MERNCQALGRTGAGQNGSMIEVGLVVGFKADEMRIERAFCKTVESSGIIEGKRLT